MKCLAIDYDGTYTAHPQLMHELAVSALSFGIEVVTVTSRRKTLENEQAMRAARISWPILFAYDKPKRLAAIEVGWDVDVWIDDNPHGIGDGTENVSTQSVFEIELRHALKCLQELKANGCETAATHRLRTRIETVLEAVP